MKRSSIYALNKKDPDAIVYRDANGEIIRLTREEFESEKEFEKWKAWSDANLHEEEKQDHLEANHTVPETGLHNARSPESDPAWILVRRIDRAKKERYNVETVIRVRHLLTKKQFKRLWMYYVDGLTQQAIADSEGVGQRRVSASISAAIRKIQKYFSENAEK